jgi:hypothetical protein
MHFSRMNQGANWFYTWWGEDPPASTAPVAGGAGGGVGRWDGGGNVLFITGLPSFPRFFPPVLLKKKRIMCGPFMVRDKMLRRTLVGAAKSRPAARKSLPLCQMVAAKRNQILNDGRVSSLQSCVVVGGRGGATAIKSNKCHSLASFPRISRLQGQQCTVQDINRSTYTINIGTTRRRKHCTHFSICTFPSNIHVHNAKNRINRDRTVQCTVLLKYVE